MTKPLTAKQEAFCQAIASGSNQADAYRKTYDAGGMKPTSVQVAASKLMSNPMVRQRVEALRKPAVEASGITLEGHLTDLARIRDLALKDGKWGPAVMAEMGRAKAGGLHVTRIEDITDPLKKAIANMPAEKAQEMIDALERIDAIREKAGRAA